MNYSIITPPTEDEMEAFLPLARARAACFVNTSRQDDDVRDYRRAAYTDGQAEARASFLPQTITANFRTPFSRVASFGLEDRVEDPDGVQGALRLPMGPVMSITSIHFMDRSGTIAEQFDSASYSMESGRFLRWSKEFTWNVTERPNFSITYVAGHAPDSLALAPLRVAIFELLAAKWDARGGAYVMPTTAKRAFHALRVSRTYLPST